MIDTLLATIFVEGALGIGYSLWQKKPVAAILVTSVVANLITQSLLWSALNLFFSHYLATLFIAEPLIWLIEGFLLYSIPANRLHFDEALLLSLGMNLASFTLGWFLPI